jgi:hypothetical protein
VTSNQGLCPPLDRASNCGLAGTRLLVATVPLRLWFMRPEAARVELNAIRALSVEERLRVAESLRAFAWELQASVIAERHPELSPSEVVERVREAFRRVLT